MIFSAYGFAASGLEESPLRRVNIVNPRDSKCPELKSVTSHPSRWVRSSIASLPSRRQSSGVHDANGGSTNRFSAKKAEASVMYRLSADRRISPQPLETNANQQLIVRRPAPTGMPQPGNLRLDLDRSHATSSKRRWLFPAF